MSPDPTHTGPVRHRKNGFVVIACDTCGFVHVAPVPTAQELEHLYHHAYYTTEKPTYIERYREDQAWWDLVNDDRLDDLEKAHGATMGRLLDVGSGPGLLLERARGRGWDVVGIEPSSQAVAHSRSLGLTIVEDFLDAHTAPALTASGRFQAIHCSFVLEHLPDPAGMLSLLSDLLVPDGALLLAVPNDENPIQYAAVATQGLQPWWIAPPHHLNYFTPTSLQGLVERVGFEVVDIQTSFPIDQFLLMGDSYVGNDALGRQVHKRRMAFELAMKAAGQNDARRELQRAQARAGIGREVVIVARKPSAPAINLTSISDNNTATQ
jgi:2-polyprenyl-3-methyl-5-hydroxy-6-metoxy-1,4-benzoquinol methylase